MGCPPPEMIYVAARAGYDYVSLRTIFMGLPGEPNYGLARNPELLEQTRRALDATGVRVHDIELARVKDGVDPRSYVPEFEIAAELGARAVLSSIWSADRAYYDREIRRDLRPREAVRADASISSRCRSPRFTTSPARSTCCARRSATTPG